MGEPTGSAPGFLSPLVRLAEDSFDVMRSFCEGTDGGGSILARGRDIMRSFDERVTGPASRVTMHQEMVTIKYIHVNVGRARKTRFLSWSL